MRIPFVSPEKLEGMIGNLLKGSRGPKANDSRYLLDVHRRDLPGEDTMRRYREQRGGRPA